MVVILWLSSARNKICKLFFQKYVFVKFENLKYHPKSSIQGRGREKSLKRKLIIYVFLVFFVQNFKHIRYRVTELFDFKVVYFYLGHPVLFDLNNPSFNSSQKNCSKCHRISLLSTYSPWNSLVLSPWTIPKHKRQRRLWGDTTSNSIPILAL